MSQQPENSDPIASAGQIDDPDQPVSRDDDHASNRKHALDETGDDTDDHERRRHADGATAAHAEDERAARGSGRPPKQVKETGFPNVDAAEVEAQHSREIDSESLAAGRKFQPPAGRSNPNLNHPAPPSANPHIFEGENISSAAEHDRDGDSSEAESYGTPENTAPAEPVKHSRMVEERIQQQEHDYDLEVTEEGERYITPHEER